MNRLAAAAFALTLAVLLAPGCASTTSTQDEILAGTAETAFFVSDLFRAIFWELPKFVLWTAPKGLLYDLPRSGLLAVRGNRAKVEANLRGLDTEDLPVEEEVRIVEELRRLTGIPIGSAERWRAWGEAVRALPEGEWRTAFVTDAIDHLQSEDYFARSDAIEDLRAVYGMDLGYDPKSGPGDLAAAAGRWRAHLAAEGVPPLED